MNNHCIEENNKHTGGCQCKQFFLNGVCEHTATNIPVTPPTESGEKRGHAHCRCMNLGGQCPNNHPYSCKICSPTEHTQAGEADYEAELDYGLYNYKNALRHRFEGTNIDSYKGEEAETKSRIFVTVRTLIDRKSAEAYERGKREREASLHVFLDLLSHGMKHNAKCLREKCHEVLVEIDALLTPPSATNNTEGV